MAPPFLGDDRTPVSIPTGHHFWKMSGSGNDFLFFDARSGPLSDISEPAVIDLICARATGVGSDGVVFIQTDTQQDFRIRYFNRDGSLGELCGNASLCSTRLASELGIVGPGEFSFATDAGAISARFVDGEPQIDLQPPTVVTPDYTPIARADGERRLGFADTGVPHVVVLLDDTSDADVLGRGAFLRNHPSLKAGANANFVAPASDGTFTIRTFERGVEGETLACGTGAVAAAILLESWGLSGPESRLRTRSGKTLTVSLRHGDGAITPSLSGEARIVFTGQLAEI